MAPLFRRATGSGWRRLLFAERQPASCNSSAQSRRIDTAEMQLINAYEIRCYGPSVYGRCFIYLYPARQLSDWTIVPTPLKSTWLTAINTEENPVGMEQTIFGGITSALLFWHGSKKWPVVKELGFACCAGRTSLTLYLSAAHTAINTADAMHAIYYRAEHNQIMQTEDKQIKVCSSSRLQHAVLFSYWPLRSAIWGKSTEWQMLPKCKVYHDLPLNANFMRLFFFFFWTLPNQQAASGLDAITISVF